ncbi:hypothetical protein Tsubulata_035814 [Turnera subulata]|uniref:DUF599 domain-containing protein n=1 Tax=Turnera subulata TaxID=218843 RepID=A0A9Q0JPT1_9ROSI|nr:hypothetical protein Tsubulata_035814 [Turnera subulata]
MELHKEYLDLFLVPAGLLIMFLYNLFLLYKHHTDPDSTSIGLENQDKKDWVKSIISQARGKDGEGKDMDRAVSVITSNTGAATNLATISLTLSSLIGTWLGTTSSQNAISNRIYGFAQAAKHLVHANYLMSSPDNIKHVRKAQFAVTKGNDFWHFGLRALYFALTVILWFFGPIPMFVSSIVMADRRDVSTALSVIASNTSSATFLASVSLTLSSLIGAWLGNSTENVFESKIIYGDTRPSTISIKYITLLSCFLLAFSCFVQSARHFVHANYLISTPDSDIPVRIVEKAVIRGSDFWSLGLRALYFALNLLLWFFGPIPMFVSSVVMVMILHSLDTNSTPLHQYGKPPRKVADRIPEVAIDIELHHRK